MLDTLLLKPSLHFTQLHLNPLHYTCQHFTFSHLNFTQLHFTTLSYGLTPFQFPTAPFHLTSHHFTSPHITSLHLTSLQWTFRWFSPHFYSFHFTPIIIAVLTLFLKILGLQGEAPNASASSWFQFLMVLFTKDKAWQQMCSVWVERNTKSEMKFTIRIQFLWDVAFRLWLTVVACYPFATGLVLFFLEPLILNIKALLSFHKCNTNPQTERRIGQTTTLKYKPVVTSNLSQHS